MATSLNSNALVSAAELETLLNITISDSDYKNSLINIASDFIERYCDRKFIQATYTGEEYDGNNDSDLYLKNAPIVAGSVTIKRWDTTEDVEDYEYDEHDDYIIYETEGYIYKRSVWAKGRALYRVTYTAGYVIGDVPYDLKMACAQIAAINKNRASNPGISSEGMGKYSVSYQANEIGEPYPAATIRVLNMYKRIRPY